MVESGEVPFLVLRRVNELAEPVRGAEKVVAACGHTCWIAPSSLRAMDDQELRTTCTECLPTMPSDIRLLPGVHEELADRWGAKNADEAIAGFEAAARVFKSLMN